jgi:hypothetical protein
MELAWYNFLNLMCFGLNGAIKQNGRFNILPIFSHFSGYLVYCLNFERQTIDLKSKNYEKTSVSGFSCHYNRRGLCTRT